MFGPRMVRRRPLLRAAVVGGGAYMAGRSAANTRQREAGQEARLNDLEQAQYQAQVPAQPPPPAAAPPASTAAAGAPAAGSPLLDQIRELTALHQQGALTDDEFAAAKAKLLG